MVTRILMILAILLPGGAATAMAARQEATPAPGGACTVEPRPVDDLIAAWFDPSATPRQRPAEPVAALDAGEPADAATAAAVVDVAREWVACTNAGEQARALALLTGAYAVQRGPVRATPNQARAALAAPPRPLPQDARLAIEPARTATLLPDGRVGTFFAVTGYARPDQAQTVLVMFAREGDRWLIDDMIGLLAPPPSMPVAGYRVLATYPHDPNAYTQGLVFIDGTLYEGTGLEGQSELRRVDLDTGMVLQRHALGEQYFGEGIAVVGDRIYQITWQSGIAFVYDRETFDRLETFAYGGEGWGLTTDGERLIMSDGSDRLFFRDPETFAVTGSVRVRDDGLPVTYLNELEYIDGEVWANVYQTDWIVRIDPASGEVIGWIDMRGLRPANDPRWENVDVLNGIARDPDSGRLFVTGKDWPELFEIELIPPS
jgi:glutamine cyclotransferase